MAKIRSIFMSLILITTPAAAFELDDLLLGFELGNTIEQAEQHALSQSWTLKPFSPNLPHTLEIEGAEATLYVCDGQVLSVQRQLGGGLDEFAALVFSLQLSLGEPTTQVASLMAGATRISIVSAKFEEENGKGAWIQLGSYDGEIRINTNVWSTIECSN